MNAEKNGNDEQIVVTNSLDVSAGRLSDEAMTLEEYRRLGGVVVIKQHEATVGTSTVTGGLNTPGHRGPGGFTTRGNHAIIVDQ